MSDKKEVSGDVVIGLLVESVETRLRVSGIDEGNAKQIAVECGEDVRAAWGGGHIYVPFGFAEKNRRRNAEIMARFTGNNYMELARRYGLTEMRIRQILSAMQRERRAPVRDLGEN